MKEELFHIIKKEVMYLTLLHNDINLPDECITVIANELEKKFKSKEISLAKEADNKTEFIDAIVDGFKSSLPPTNYPKKYIHRKKFSHSMNVLEFINNNSINVVAMYFITNDADGLPHCLFYTEKYDGKTH